MACSVSLADSNAYSDIWFHSLKQEKDCKSKIAQNKIQKKKSPHVLSQLKIKYKRLYERINSVRNEVQREARRLARFRCTTTTVKMSYCRDGMTGFAHPCTKVIYNREIIRFPVFFQSFHAWIFVNTQQWKKFLWIGTFIKSNKDDTDLELDWLDVYDLKRTRKFFLDWKEYRMMN